MPVSFLAQVEHDVRSRGYRLISSEQLRSNRWLLIARDATAHTVAILLQVRPLVSEADVQDLDEIVRVRRLDAGILLIPTGKPTVHAQRALRDLSQGRLQICGTLPQAATTEANAAQRLSAIVPPAR